MAAKSPKKSEKSVLPKPQDYLLSLEALVGLPTTTIDKELELKGVWNDLLRLVPDRILKDYKDRLTPNEARILYGISMGTMTPLVNNVKAMLRDKNPKVGLVDTAYTIYTGLVKLAKTNTCTKKCVWTRGPYVEPGKCEIMFQNTPTYGDKKTAISYDHNVPTMSIKPKDSSDHKNFEILWQVHCLPNEEWAMHSPVKISDISDVPIEDEYIFPFLTSFLAIETRTEETVFRNYLIVELEATYLPQVFKIHSRPTEAIWADVKDMKADLLREWITTHPLTDLEYRHHDYQCAFLYSAARFGNTEAVRLMLENCADINSQDSGRQSTALHAATFFGHPETTELLLKCEANPFLINGFGRTPLDDMQFSEAPEEKKEEIKKLLTMDEKKEKEEKERRMGARHLVYGNRLDFVRGFDELLGRPKISMKAEATRDAEDKKCFDEACQTAVTLMKCREAIEAKLTVDEVIALRFYTSDSYKPINSFLRQLGAAGHHEGKRAELLAADKTWVSTVYTIYSGIMKLSSLELPSDSAGGSSGSSSSLESSSSESSSSSSTSPSKSSTAKSEEDEDPRYPSLFRGIDIPLPPKFFVPDERGMIAATEYGFMSTSFVEEVGRGFADKGVLLRVKCRRRDAGGYHMGACLEWLTVFKGEREVLFPPYTLFQVIKRERDLDKNLTIITVVPTYMVTAPSSGKGIFAFFSGIFG